MVRMMCADHIHAVVSAIMLLVKVQLSTVMGQHMHVQHSTAQHSTAQHSTAQHSTAHQS
jgi:hypothetical protein